MVCPWLCLEVAAPEKKVTEFLTLLCKKVHLTSGYHRMQLTLHATRRTPHGASRLVQAMSAWSVITRRAPSWHGRDATVYGPTTTAEHDNEYPRPESY